MRYLTAALVLAPLLAGCAFTAPAVIEGVADQAEDAGEGQALTARAADRIIPVSARFRAVRAALLMTVILNVQTVKVTALEPQRRAEVLGNIALVRAGIEALRAPSSDHWQNTVMGEVTIGAGSALADTLRTKIVTYAARVTDLVGGVRFFASSAAIDSVMLSASVQDARAIAATLDAGGMTEDEAWGVIGARLDVLQRRLSQ